MANVPFAGPQGLAQAPGTIIPDDYNRTQANPAAFGAQIGQGEQQLGQGIEQGADAGLGIIRTQQLIYNRASVTDSLTKAQERAQNTLYGDPSDPNSKGFLSLQGGDALSGRQAAAQAITQAYQDARDGLTTDAQRNLFDREQRRAMLSNLQQVSAHAIRQGQVYALDSQQSAVQNGLRGAALGYNDDNLFQQNLGTALDAQAHHDAMLGLPAETMQANRAELTSKAWQQRIIQTGEDNPGAAAAMLQANRGNLDTQTYAALNERLHGKLVKSEGEAAGMAAFQGSMGYGGGGGAAPVAPGAIPPEQRQPMLQRAVSGTAVPAEVLGAVVQQESSWNPNEPNGGLGQVLESTARSPGMGMAGVDPASLKDPDANLAFSARYLEARGKALGMQPADWRNPAKVAQALAAYNGGGDPNYVQHVSRYLPPNLRQGGMQTPDGSPITLASTNQGSSSIAGPTMPYPDKDAIMARIAQINDPEVASHAASTALRQVSLYQAGIANQQKAMSGQIDDTIAALTDGRDVDAPAPATIRHLFPPATADQIIEKLGEAQDFSTIRRSVDTASPQDIADMRNQLASNTGLLPTMLKLRKAAFSDPDAPQAPDDATSGSITPQAAGPEPGNVAAPGYRNQSRLQQQFETVVAARNKALMADPAAFVAQKSPTVAAALLATSQGKMAPADYVNASLGEQARLGVPEDQRRAIPAQQAQQLVQQIRGADPAKQDVGKQLDTLAQEYAGAWPQVFGDLVHAGLDPHYQVMATMTQPDQAVARDDLQRSLQFVAKNGGIPKLREAVPKDAAQDIDQNIDATMAPFMATNRDAIDGGISLNDQVKESVRALAYYNASQGRSDPLGAAYDGIIGRKYDMDGTMRVPKGQMSDVRAATSAMLDSLKPTDLADIGGPSFSTTPERQAMTLDAAKRGRWSPNEDDSGLVLMGLRRDAGYVPVMRTDGSRVEVKFKDAIGSKSVSQPGTRPVSGQPTQGLPMAQPDDGSYQPSAQVGNGG